MSRRMNRVSLIASSSLFVFNRGPSINACRVSKFHFVCSFVFMSCVSIIVAWKTRSSICMLILSFTCSTCRWPRRTASSTELALEKYGVQICYPLKGQMQTNRRRAPLIGPPGSNLARFRLKLSIDDKAEDPIIRLSPSL